MSLIPWSGVSAQGAGTGGDSLKNEIQQQLVEFGGKDGANLGDPSDPRVIIARLIKWTLGIVGVVGVVLALYAGFLIMTSAGNEEKIETGKKILLYSVGGLIIVITAYSIVLFVYTGIYNSWTNPMTIGSRGDVYIRPNDSSFYNNSDPLEGDTSIGGGMQW
jgi:hypothetical protein